MRKLALTTKNVNKGFYKGTRTGSMGTHTKYGGYRLDWDKVRTYRVPDISEFRVSLHPLSLQSHTSAPTSYDRMIISMQYL